MKVFKNFICILMCAAMLFGMTATAFADEKAETVYQISSESDLVKLSAMCRIDTASVNVVVNLLSDIELHGDFEPIPIFSGKFNGNGHKITGLNVSGKYSYSGLFGILTENAVVRDLTVCGNVIPGGDTSAAGGIAGINNGTIESCTFSGSVKGIYSVGGIAGNNIGKIIDCKNYAKINVNYKDEKLTISDIKALKITDIPNILTLKAAENIGGIAGTNAGCISSCNNYGEVGTSGNGYKIGGIAGENSGYISMCSNAAKVSGKQKTGGIAGQTIPFIKTEYSKDYLSPVTDGLSDILSVVDQITYDIDNDADVIAASIVQITNIISSASSHANMLTNSVYYYANDITGDVNEIVHFATTATSGLGPVTKDIANVSTELTKSVNDVKKIVEIVKNGGSSSDYLPYINDSLNGIGSAIESVGNATVDVNKMVEAMNNVKPDGFTQLSPEIKDSLSYLMGDISALSGAIKSLSLSLNGAEKQLTQDIRSITQDVRSLVDSVSDIAYSLTDLTIKDLLKDVSGDTVYANDSKYGIIENCLNTGYILADETAGGIVGYMGFTTSISINPGDAPDSFSVKTLSYRSIVSYSRNYGYVSTSKDYCGSICGNESAGAIVNCQGYGYIESKQGSYVGGIAGSASGLIRDCFSKVVLDGADYVAGIIGGGSSGGLLSGTSTVAGCAADAKVLSDCQHKGGISGSDNGLFAFNYFLTGDLNGMESYSVELEAAPVSKQTLLGIKDCPKEFSWSEEQLLSTATALNKTDNNKNKVSYIIAVLASVMFVAAVITLILVNSYRKKEKEQLMDTKPSQQLKE